MSVKYMIISYLLYVYTCVWMCVYLLNHILGTNFVPKSEQNLIKTFFFIFIFLLTI